MYIKTHNIRKKKYSCPTSGFETAIFAVECKFVLYVGFFLGGGGILVFETKGPAIPPHDPEPESDSVTFSKKNTQVRSISVDLITLNTTLNS